MAVLAPIITIASTLLASAGTFGSILLSVGFTAASQLLNKPKRGQAAAQQTGRQLSLATATDIPNTAVLGEMAVGGSLVFRSLSGSSNENLYMVINLADHECDGLVGIIVNGKKINWNPETGLSAEYGRHLKITFFNGADNQEASTELIQNSGGKWTSNHKGVGRCYAVVKIVYSDSVWATGFPDFRWILRGLKLYDWRLDSTRGGIGSQRYDDPSSWQYSDNPVVAYVNYIVGIKSHGVKRWGRNVPLNAIDLNAATAAANSCDESVALSLGGSEKRYTIGATFNANAKHTDIEKMILETFMGTRVTTGGFTRIKAGVAQIPVMTFSDDDRIIDSDVLWAPKLTADQLVNTVKGKFSDPKQNYEPGTQTARFSSSDIDFDGGELSVENDFEGVTSGTQCQRLMEILRREARLQGRFSVTYGARAELLEVGDWISVSSKQFNWLNKPFEVAKVEIGGELVGAKLELREIYSNVFDWTVDDEIHPGETGELLQYSPPTFPITNISVSNLTITSSRGDRRPGLDVRWDAIDDTRVLSVLIQYRQVGSTDVLTQESFQPISGSHQFVTSILSNTTYEVRARVVLRNGEAGVQWTAWVRPVNNQVSSEIVVARAVQSEGVSNPIPFDALSEDVQNRLGINDEFVSLMGTLDSSRLAQAERAAEAALSNMIDLVEETEERTNLEQHLIDRISETSARLDTQLLVLTDQDNALAQSIENLGTSVDQHFTAEIQQVNQTISTNQAATATQIDQVSTTVGEHTTSITQHTESIDGFKSSWALLVSDDGIVTGGVQLSGESQTSEFAVLADKFKVALPTTGEIIPAFLIEADENGAPQIIFNGKLKGDSIIASRISSASGRSWWDLTTDERVVEVDL